MKPVYSPTGCWTVDHYANESLVLKDKVNIVAVVSPRNGQDAVATSSRIVACVNALAGVEDPEAFMADLRSARAAFNSEDPSIVAQVSSIRHAFKHLKGGE